MFQVMSRTDPFPLQIYISFRLANYFPVSKGIIGLFIILICFIFWGFFRAYLIKSTMRRCQIALRSSKKGEQQPSGNAAVVQDVGLCPWFYGVTLLELTPIFVLVSAMKVGWFKRHFWRHLSAFSLCWGLQITVIEDRKAMLLRDLPCLVEYVSCLFQETGCSLKDDIELCLILSRYKLGKASFEAARANPELVQTQTETLDLAPVRAGGSDRHCTEKWLGSTVSAFSSNPGGTTLRPLKNHINSQH